MLRRLLGQLEFLLDPPPLRPDPPATKAASPALPVPLEFVRHPRARRYILRLGRDRVARVTIPRGGSEAFARRFVVQQLPWLHRQLERLASAPPAAPETWGPGTPVWFRGERMPLTLADGRVRLGDHDLELDPDAIPAGSDWRVPVEGALRRLAAAELPPLVLALAARHGVPVKRISVRSQRSRWGSCSRRGTVSLNWRLVQTPILVRDYIVAHELAHFREMNHSRRFWRVVADFFPSWREAETWLRRHGRELIR